MLQNKKKSGEGSKTGQEQAQNHAEIAGGPDTVVEMEHNFEEHLVPIFQLSRRRKVIGSINSSNAVMMQRRRRKEES